MKRTTIKFFAAGTIVLAAVGYLAYAGLSDGAVQYHLQVDAFAANPQYHAQRVRLAGRVADEGTVVGAGRLGARFVLEGHAQRVRVDYAGVVPDLFKPGCEVIVEGKLDPAGTFRADLVMTKCASKYESAEHKHGGGEQEKAEGRP